jgi:hypothetical protein
MSEISIESTSGFVIALITRPHDRGFQLRLVRPDGTFECYWNIYPSDFDLGGGQSLVATRRDILRNVARRGFTLDERARFDRTWFAFLDAMGSDR